MTDNEIEGLGEAARSALPVEVKVAYVARQVGREDVSPFDAGGRNGDPVAAARALASYMATANGGGAIDNSERRQAHRETRDRLAIILEGGTA